MVIGALVTYHEVGSRNHTNVSNTRWAYEQVGPPAPPNDTPPLGGRGKRVVPSVSVQLVHHQALSHVVTPVQQTTRMAFSIRPARQYLSPVHPALSSSTHHQPLSVFRSTRVCFTPHTQPLITEILRG